MATKKESTSSEGSSQFSIELGPHDLTDEEITNIGNEITKAVVDAVQRSAKAAEVYVKILYVKQTHSKVVHQ
jgi:ribosomal protein L1